MYTKRLFIGHSKINKNISSVKRAKCFSFFLFCFAKNVQGSICDVCIDNNLLTHKYLHTKQRNSLQVTLETGAIKELSELSNCSILQGTKVGSAKEYGQEYLNSPESGSTNQYTLLQAKSSNIKEIEYPPVDLNTPPNSSIYIFLTSIPGSLGLKIVPRQYPTIQRNHFPTIQISPRRVQSSFPRKVGIHISPSSKLIPSRFWKLTPRRARTRRPGLI